MNILAWTLFGLFIAILTIVFDYKRTKQTLAATLIISIVGALTGGMAAELLFGKGISGINTTTLILSVFMSSLFLYMGDTLRKTS